MTSSCLWSTRRTAIGFGPKERDPTLTLAPNLTEQELLHRLVQVYFHWKSLHHFRCVEFKYGSFRKLGVPYFGVLIIRILLFRA